VSPERLLRLVYWLQRLMLRVHMRHYLSEHAVLAMSFRFCGASIGSDWEPAFDWNVPQQPAAQNHVCLLRCVSFDQQHRPRIRLRFHLLRLAVPKLYSLALTARSLATLTLATLTLATLTLADLNACNTACELVVCDGGLSALPTDKWGHMRYGWR